MTRTHTKAPNWLKWIASKIERHCPDLWCVCSRRDLGVVCWSTQPMTLTQATVIHHFIAVSVNCIYCKSTTNVCLPGQLKYETICIFAFPTQATQLNLAQTWLVISFDVYLKHISHRCIYNRKRNHCCREWRNCFCATYFAIHANSERHLNRIYKVKVAICPRKYDSEFLLFIYTWMFL